ncbi:MAG: M23 family metallopeptidase [Gemmatimonadaceae bacterium]|nr:M23 family metallopeptidase [Gemmatimonadaceae bacterium]
MKEKSDLPADTSHSVSASVSLPNVLSSTSSVDSAVAQRTDSTTENSLSVVTPSPAPFSDAALETLRDELIIPVTGVFSRELRDTFTEARGSNRVHDAIDIPAPRGTPVIAATPGRVLKLFTSKAGGLMVYAADSSERFILMYAHLDGYAPDLIDGAPLKRGQTIGSVGTTGNAPPNVPHLHFAIARSADISKWWQGAAVNPYTLLKNK